MVAKKQPAAASVNLLPPQMYALLHKLTDVTALLLNTVRSAVNRPRLQLIVNSAVAMKMENAKLPKPVQVNA
ncbi:TPA: hypothetical protein DIV55_02760 [Patescibacteria group bacterium]|uniref:Uncharacterized protein n=1 Tax=Candidatus Gottesmanbacteria bacterium GW2011_GWA1_43_11 TaxID=1618436 RepID=A0A0G1CCY4_9BACT|nr:MAG: hypothetical protein UV59_C0037G0019 [Candidatus Gottesmanbacteria bacterium GW2011_GWA1_43_11]HCS78641.1 hypothetical protein [Patescibacteria group bacterium]